MAALLNKMNPQFYAVYQDILGESADWNELKVQTIGEDAEADATDLVAIDVVDRDGSLLWFD
jgi:hypothetical protein